MSIALALDHVRVVLGGAVIIHDVTLGFAADRVHAIIGRSGAGKSVWMKAVAGLLPCRGTVRVHKEPLVFVHQDPSLIDTLDVEENVAFALSRRPLPGAEVRERLEATLAVLGLEALRRRAPSELTVAVQKRVALARALCLRPGILIVDEPTTGLDPAAAAAVDDALASLSGTTLIVITHSPRTLERLRPDIVLVEEGHVRPLAGRAA